MSHGGGNSVELLQLGLEARILALELGHTSSQRIGSGLTTTPLGLKAMEDLNKLNNTPGVATNAMCMFLTVNTAGVQLIPASMVSLMASAGSKDPTAIIGTTFAATAISLIAGLAAAKILERLPIFSADVAKEGGEPS